MTDAISDPSSTLSFAGMVFMVDQYFEDRATLSAIQASQQTYEAVLYGAVVCRWALDTASRSVVATVIVGAEGIKVDVADPRFVSKAVRGPADDMLKRFDEHVRLRLPDDYLQRLESRSDTEVLQHSGPRLRYAELYDLAREVFGSRLSQQSGNAASREVRGVLYDAFPFSCGFDNPNTGLFSGGVQVHPGLLTGHLLDSSISLNGDRQSLLDGFQLMDEYCRLRLPEKYLQAYEARVGGKHD